MKRTKSPKKSAAGAAKAITVEQYLARVPEPARTTMNKIRAAIRSAVPAAAIEVISYRMPAFRHNGIVVWYAAFSEHCSLFPTASVIEALRDELKPFIASKGTVQFPIGKPPSAALVKKIVKTRLAQMDAK